MIIDATFWVAISFIIFIGGLIYLKVPQKINYLMNNMIKDIKNCFSLFNKTEKKHYGLFVFLLDMNYNFL